jgi:hypothetical protein
MFFKYFWLEFFLKKVDLVLIKPNYTELNKKKNHINKKPIKIKLVKNNKIESSIIKLYLFSLVLLKIKQKERELV